MTPRYISSKDKTDFISAHGLENVWMIAKCKPGVARYLDDRIVAKCLRPASNSSLRSLVPVTDGVLHYRSVQ